MDPSIPSRRPFFFKRTFGRFSFGHRGSGIPPPGYIDGRPRPTRRHSSHLFGQNHCLFPICFEPPCANPCSSTDEVGYDADCEDEEAVAEPFSGHSHLGTPEDREGLPRPTLVFSTQDRVRMVESPKRECHCEEFELVRDEEGDKERTVRFQSVMWKPRESSVDSTGSARSSGMEGGNVYYAAERCCQAENRRRSNIEELERRRRASLAKGKGKGIAYGH